MRSYILSFSGKIGAVASRNINLNLIRNFR
jgi:hypothetical protein